MYDYLKGKVVHKKESSKGAYLTVENNNIGYLIEVAPKDLKVNIDDEITIYTVLIHKEDSMYLCGFLQQEARDIFKILTSVSGVGVKMGLTLINEFELPDLIANVVNENFKSLTVAKGVGIKLAQKIILELKDKLTDVNITPSDNDISECTREVEKVLISLGYEPKEITQALVKASALAKDKENSEEILKLSLQILST